MNLNQLDIIVSDVIQVCASLERILDKKADYVDDNFAQFTIGSHCLMLSQNHLVPLENFQSGIILHIEVEDVDQNYKRLKELGIQVLNGPVVTDWDVGSSHPGAEVGPKGWAVRPLKRYASWVQNVVRQFGPYLYGLFLCLILYF